MESTQKAGGEVWERDKKGHSRPALAKISTQKAGEVWERDKKATMLGGNVWVHEQTLACAMNSCIPCQYKLCPSGEGLPPNQRPEMCPRSRPDAPYHGLYQSGAILCLGDGDFSFSLSLARGLSDRSGLLASSHESHESVLSTYNKSTDILGELHSLLPGRVLHGVDATSLSSTPALEGILWDLLVWNFPCVASSSAPADGQVQEIDRNKRLLLDFFSNARAFLSAAGEIHVTHKTFEPFSWWGIVELAEQSGLEFLGSFVFDRCLYPGYINRKVKDKKSFPLHDARTFVFAVPQGAGPPSDSDSGEKRRPRAVSALGMRVLDATTEELLRKTAPAKTATKAKSNTVVESAAQEDVAPSPASSAGSMSPAASLGKRKVQGKTAAPRVRTKQLTAVEEEDEEEKGLIEDE